MLQIKNISKEYRTGELIQRALDGVSLNLRDNEFVAILGPSGSGKTTLLNIIGGLDRYDDGDLIINGVSTKEYKERDWDTYRNHSIGFVFQSYNLIQHQNVLANVELALTISGISAKERKEKAIRALEQVGLGDQIYKKPNQMSGGQMQRVALARALVNDPDILLADEPTGALDSETSIQVMNLMKEVAKDRLVVMVTHNPELAEEYATRIVRLKDGQIIDDSMPCTDAELMEEAAPLAAALPDMDGQEENVSKARPQKRLASMSFLTSLALSFSNLRTKKGRTILTSFAGSIGIIGIALILSLSTGVNDYIDKIQRDTMASYPISISATSFDFGALMGTGAGDSEEPESSEADQKSEELPKDTLSASFRDIKTSSAVTTSIKTNNLTEFKKYLDDEKSEIHQYIGDNGIIYTYNVDFKVFSYDKDHKLVDSDYDLTQEFTDENNVLGNLYGAREMMLSNMSAMFGGGTQNAANFSEMTAGANGDTISAMIKDNYEVLYGNWPDSYDEVVLVLNENGTLNSGQLFQLGLITKRQYEAAVRKVEAEEEPDPIRLNYKDLCDHEFLLLTASDQYLKNEGGTFTSIGNDEEKLEKVLEDAIHLRIVGIVKETEDSGITGITTPVGYTAKLTDHIINYTNESEVVKAQKQNEEIDVLSGQAFMEEEPDDASKAQKGREYIEKMTASEKENFFSSLMMVDYEGTMQALMTTQMTALSEQIGSTLQRAIGTALSGAVQTAVEQVVRQVMNQTMDAVKNTMTQAMSQVTEQMMKQAMQQLSGEVVSKAMQKIMEQVASEVLPQVMKEAAEKIMPQIIQQSLEANITDLLDQVRTQLPEGFEEELKKLEGLTSFEEFANAIQSIDFSQYDFSQVDLSQVTFNPLDFSKVDYSKIDFSGMDLSALDLSKVDISNLDLGDLNFDNFTFDTSAFNNIDLSQMDFSSMDFSGINLNGLDFSGLDFGNMDLSGMDLSAGDGKGSAEMVDYWLANNADQKDFVKIYDQFIGVSNYDGNMKKFGYISYDAPSSISLYADSFEGKDGITESLKHYNDAAEKENKITYTDYVALLTTSITTIINAISYVLIGFVAVSLFVSCIMIGIITNISVLERTKEIGVLRALGASKRNVSNVFNAETFIIGGFSGILGVAVSLLLTVPINAVVHSLMDSTVLSAKLPPVSAIILVVISIVITMIGGLLPAKKASNQDPVVALRTE